MKNKNFFLGVAEQDRHAQHVLVKGPYGFCHVKNMFKAGIINAGTRFMVRACMWGRDGSNTCVGAVLVGYRSRSLCKGASTNPAGKAMHSPLSRLSRP
jgi:hypothetical protein